MINALHITDSDEICKGICDMQGIFTYRVKK